MKKVLLAVFALCIASAATNAQADWTLDLMRTHMQFAAASAMAARPHSEEAINWKVGDTASYSMTLAGAAKIGTMVETATQEEGNGVWMESDVTGAQNQKSAMLFDRTDGHIIKYTENGVEKPIPDQSVNVVSQDEQNVTVPAGTFDTIHIVATSTSNGVSSNVEVWMNPSVIALEGSAKQTVKAKHIPVALELLSFTKQPQ